MPPFSYPHKPLPRTCFRPPTFAPFAFCRSRLLPATSTVPGYLLFRSPGLSLRYTLLCKNPLRRPLRRTAVIFPGSTRSLVLSRPLLRCTCPTSILQFYRLAPLVRFILWLPRCGVGPFICAFCDPAFAKASTFAKASADKTADRPAFAPPCASVSPLPEFPFRCLPPNPQFPLANPPANVILLGLGTYLLTFT